MIIIFCISMHFKIIEELSSLKLYLLYSKYLTIQNTRIIRRTFINKLNTCIILNILHITILNIIMVRNTPNTILTLLF